MTILCGVRFFQLAGLLSSSSKNVVTSLRPTVHSSQPYHSLACFSTAIGVSRFGSVQNDWEPLPLASACGGSACADRELTIPRHERKAARRTRSFRRRQAPVTKRQRQQLRQLWPKYGLSMNFKNRWDFDDLFSTPPGTAVTLDIGFGSGESLLEMAAARPAENFVGIEVHKPGVAKALERIEAEALPNVKVVLGDAVTALCDHVEDHSLNECCVFFPDPFPLSRDSKRRLVRPLLLSLLSSKMRPGGVLSIATDVEEYADHVVRVMTMRPVLISSAPVDELSQGARSGADERQKELPATAVAHSAAQAGRGTATALSSGNVWAGGEIAARNPCRPSTTYEEKARAAGRRVRDFRYRLEHNCAKVDCPT